MRRATSRATHKNRPSVASADWVEALANEIDDSVRRSAGAVRNLIQQFLPKGAENEVKMALAYAEGDCDLTSDICRTKRSFYANGFRMVAKSATVDSAKPTKKPKASDKSTDEFDALNLAIEDMVVLHKLRFIAEELVFTFVACDNAVLHCKLESGQIDYVQSLDPRDIDWAKSSNTQLALRLPTDFITSIKNMLKEKGGRAKLAGIFPEKYIKAVEDNTNLVLLLNEDGEYWWHGTAGRRWTGLCRPSHRQIAPDVILRQILVDGDFSAGYFTKNIIQQVKMGEAGPTNQPAMGKRGPTWATTEDMKALNAKLKELNKAMRLMTDHTVEIKYVFPDKEVWDPAKYLKVEDRILRWGGTPEQLLTGRGDGHAQGQTGFVRFAADGEFVRGRIGDLFVDMFSHADLRNAWGLTDQTRVKAVWNQQNLKSPKVAQDETTTAYDRGILPVETYHERIGEDHEVQKSRMKKQQQQKGLWQPAFEKSQGLLTKDGKDGSGRPDEGEGVSDSDGPRKSRGE